MMQLQIQKKQMDESSHCSLCQASMFWVEAEYYEQDIYFHECSHCHHRIFSADSRLNCHCERCTIQRKKISQQILKQERSKIQSKDEIIYDLNQLSFIHKLFLLSVLDHYAREDVSHDEFIDWQNIKYHHFTPNYLFQNKIFQELFKIGILKPKDQNLDSEVFYLNLRLDGYVDPSLFSITNQLRNWFYQNLSFGIPFQTADEVKDVLYLILYQEVIQFMQFYCRKWNIQIAGNQKFQVFCYRLMDNLAVGQIYYLIQTALEYLYKQKALQTHNDKFINTNLLKKTLERYRENALMNKWETRTLQRPQSIPFSKMSEILLFKFLGYDEKIFFQPILKSWRKIEPRLSFYSLKRCMFCGSNDLSVDYDAKDYVSLICRHCKHQDHYFIR